MQNKREYLQSQVGNPEGKENIPPISRFFYPYKFCGGPQNLTNISTGEDKPNKKYFDPRVFIREGEK